MNRIIVIDESDNSSLVQFVVCVHVFRQCRSRAIASFNNRKCAGYIFFFLREDAEKEKRRKFPEKRKTHKKKKVFDDEASQEKKNTAFHSLNTYKRYLKALKFKEITVRRFFDVQSFITDAMVIVMFSALFRVVIFANLRKYMKI